MNSCEENKYRELVTRSVGHQTAKVRTSFLKFFDRINKIYKMKSDLIHLVNLVDKTVAQRLLFSVR